MWLTSLTAASLVPSCPLFLTPVGEVDSVREGVVEHVVGLLRKGVLRNRLKNK